MCHICWLVGVINDDDDDDDDSRKRHTGCDDACIISDTVVVNPPIKS